MDKLDPMPEKKLAKENSRTFNRENLFIEYAENAIRGKLPAVDLPKGFPADPVWQNWPGKIYQHLFNRDKKSSETGIDESRAADIIKEFLTGKSGKNRELLLPHLHFRQHRQPGKMKKPDFAEALSSLFTLLQQQGDRQWINTEDFMREGAGLPGVKSCLDPDYSADYIYYETRGEYRNFLGDSGTRDEQRYLESPLLQNQACIEPLIVNYLAAAIILGLAEARYHPWLENFSPWEGISHIRFTHWGKYVLGLSAIAPVWQSSGCIGYSDEGLFALLKRESFRCRTLLEKCGDEIAPGQFHISPGKISSICSSEEELDQVISELRSAAFHELPPSWEEFFSLLKSRVVQLPADKEWVLIDLPPDSSLSAVLTANTEFEGLFLKVEGMRILVHQEKIETFRRKLQKTGFFPQFY